MKISCILAGDDTRQLLCKGKPSSVIQVQNSRLFPNSSAISYIKMLIMQLQHNKNFRMSQKLQGARACRNLSLAKPHFAKSHRLSCQKSKKNVCGVRDETNECSGFDQKKAFEVVWPVQLETSFVRKTKFACPTKVLQTGTKAHSSVHLKHSDNSLLRLQAYTVSSLQQIGWCLINK